MSYKQLGGRDMAFFNDLKKSISEVSETVVKKSGNIVEIQKLKSKRSSLESECKDLYEKLGKMYFDIYVAGDMTDMEASQICEQIQANQEAQEETTQAITRAKGTTLCPNCKAEISTEVSFCPKCGFNVVPKAEEDEDNKSTAESVVESIFEVADDVADKAGNVVEDIKEALNPQETASPEASVAEEAPAEDTPMAEAAESEETVKEEA